MLANTESPLGRRKAIVVIIVLLRRCTSSRGRSVDVKHSRTYVTPVWRRQRILAWTRIANVDCGDYLVGCRINLYLVYRS